MKIKTILISDKLDSSYEERTSSCQLLHKCKMHSLPTQPPISLVYCFRFSHFSIPISCLCMSSKRNRKAVKTTPQFENSPASFLCLPFLIMKGKRCNNVCVIQRPAAQPRLRLLFGNDVNARQNDEPVFVVYVYPLHFHLLAHHPKITQKLHRVQMNDVYDCEIVSFVR